MSKPAIRVFTKDEPCNKMHIWNCFRTRRGFKSVQVDIAKSEIGANAPKNMLTHGYIEVISKNDADHYELTEDGKVWLKAGIAGFVKRHPEDAGEVVHLPKGLAA